MGGGERFLARFNSLVFHAIGLDHAFVVCFVVPHCTEICKESDIILLVRESNCE